MNSYQSQHVKDPASYDLDILIQAYNVMAAIKHRAPIPPDASKVDVLAAIAANVKNKQALLSHVHAGQRARDLGQ